MKLTKAICRDLLREQLGIKSRVPIEWVVSKYNPKDRTAVAYLSDNVKVSFTCDDSTEFEQIQMTLQPVNPDWKFAWLGQINALLLFFNANTLDLIERNVCPKEGASHELST